MSTPTIIEGDLIVHGNIICEGGVDITADGDITGVTGYPVGIEGDLRGVWGYLSGIGALDESLGATPDPS